MNKLRLIAVVLSLTCLGCNNPSGTTATNSPAPPPASTPEAGPNAVTPEASPTAVASTQLPVGDTTQTSVDWAGTYKGVLPCADCEGIETEVVLNDDGTFKHTTIYLGKDGEPEVIEGSFIWKEDGATVVLPNGEQQTHYWVSENYILQLDPEGNKIEGEMAEKYVLQKA